MSLCLLEFWVPQHEVSSTFTLVWGLGHVFEGKLYFTKDIVDDSFAPTCTPPPRIVPHPLSFPGGGGGRHLVNPKSPRREVVRSSAGAGVIYPPFLGSFA